MRSVTGALYHRSDCCFNLRPSQGNGRCGPGTTRFRRGARKSCKRSGRLLSPSCGLRRHRCADTGRTKPGRSRGTNCCQIGHAGPREAAVYLPETLRPALGSETHAVLYGETASVPARLRQLSDSADRETRTFEARYVFGPLGANAPLGATVTVQVPKKDSSDPEEVPIAAITDRGNGPGVWVFNQGTSTVSFQRVRRFV